MSPENKSLEPKNFILTKKQKVYDYVFKSIATLRSYTPNLVTEDELFGKLSYGNTCAHGLTHRQSNIIICRAAWS